MRNYVLAPLRELLQLILPESCNACGKALEGDERFFCINCLAMLPLVHDAAGCDNIAEQRLAGRFHFEAAMSYMLFRHGNATQRIVHRIKYYGHERLGVFMGRLMGDTLLASHRFDTIDCIVPVPLHRRRQWHRGFNQSWHLAQGIAQVLNKEVVDDAVARVAFTETQTHKGREERMDNIRNAFAVVRPERLEGRHILLVDDVITTGSTIGECAETILKVADTKISIASLSITVG